MQAVHSGNYAKRSTQQPDVLLTILKHKKMHPCHILPNGKTVLNAALEYGLDATTFQNLLEKISNKPLYEFCDSASKATPLHIAVSNKLYSHAKAMVQYTRENHCRYKFVRLLLSMNKKRQTALHIASSMLSSELVHLLFSVELDERVTDVMVKQEDGLGNTALQCAVHAAFAHHAQGEAMENSSHFFTTFVSRKANSIVQMTRASRQNIIHTLAQSDQSVVILDAMYNAIPNKELWKEAIQAKDKNNFTPLDLALHMGHCNVAQFIMSTLQQP